MSSIKPLLVMIGGERRLIGGLTPTATELSRGGSAIIKRALLDGAGALLDGARALLDGAGALLDGDRALLDGDEAVSRWRRSSLTVALLESQTGKASVVSCYNFLAMEQNNWICLLRGSTKQEEGTSKQWTAKQSNTVLPSSFLSVFCTFSGMDSNTYRPSGNFVDLLTSQQGGYWTLCNSRIMSWTVLQLSSLLSVTDQQRNLGIMLLFVTDCG
ncbi:hypothetical protein F2Q69_00005660 [Brassica cretica]|uniref:Uncharacterized protein n=1 Tax=Brassica cretica TaxID=69181 RepID=A0A8S9P7T1_BRACR|nr:hypothetical protein F2Q69_00005660 [Brassica cretica]